MNLVLLLAALELTIFQDYAIIDKSNEIVKVFSTLNAKDQCEHYAKWYGRKARCVKL